MLTGTTYLLFPWDIDSELLGFIPPFDAEWRVRVPDSYPDTEYHTLIAEVQLRAICVEDRIVPELTDELVMEKTGFETIDAFRKHLRREARKQFSANGRH